MTSARIGLLLTLWLGVPCLFFGQGTPPEKKPQAAQMKEDIEIMRRIVNHVLDLPRHAPQAVRTNNDNYDNTILVPNPGGISQWVLNPGVIGQNQGPIHKWDTWNNTGINQPQLIWPNTGVAWVSTLRHPAAEGVYLKGHGVVLTLTLPPQKDFKPTESAPAEKSQTEWERVRKEIRGENVDGADKKPKEPTSADILIKVLAENGKHFTQLSSDETVTIVVTFRPAGGQELIQLSSDDAALHSLLDTQSVKSVPTNEGSAAPVAGGDVTTTGPSGKVKDSVLLGDLHYKQGKFADAVQAYTAALKQIQDTLNDSVGWEVHSEVCQKLAQALLAEGKIEEAKEYLEIAVEKKKRRVQTPPKKDPPPAPLPSKLILSAPKKLLDQVGSGKMSLEEFKQQVTVEYEHAAANK